MKHQIRSRTLNNKIHPLTQGSVLISSIGAFHIRKMSSSAKNTYSVPMLSHKLMYEINPIKHLWERVLVCPKNILAITYILTYLFGKLVGTSSVHNEKAYALGNLSLLLGYQKPGTQ